MCVATGYYTDQSGDSQALIETLSGAKWTPTQAPQSCCGAKTSGTARRRAVYAAGDVLAPRMPSEAIFDGHRLGREIDTADPMTPAPVLIERPPA